MISVSALVEYFLINGDQSNSEQGLVSGFYQHIWNWFELYQTWQKW